MVFRVRDIQVEDFRVDDIRVEDIRVGDIRVEDSGTTRQPDNGHQGRRHLGIRTSRQMMQHFKVRRCL